MPILLAKELNVFYEKQLIGSMKTAAFTMVLEIEDARFLLFRLRVLPPAIID